MTEMIVQSLDSQIWEMQNTLHKFEQTVMDAGPSVTKQMLVFMVKGVLSNFIFRMVSIQHVG